jgi:hypothetical protein
LLLNFYHGHYCKAKFYGNTAEDPSKYLQQFELASVSNQRDDTIKAVQLPNYLAGSAQIWVISWLTSRPAGNKLVWVDITDALQKAFSSVAEKAIAEERMLRRKQKVLRLFNDMKQCHGLDV